MRDEDGKPCTTTESLEERWRRHFIFVDLRITYDSVPRDGLWKVFRKLGIPENVIASFHENMNAPICCNGMLSDDI